MPHPFRLLSIRGPLPRALWRLGAAALAGAALTVSLLTARARRTSPGQAVAERSRTPAGMVYVPAGAFLMGSNDGDADDDVKPRHSVDLAAYYIDRTEVTNAEFRRFRPDRLFPPGEGERPATNVTCAEAEAYARWAGKRLPTEAEWEKAARGTDGRRYPWGNEWDPGRVAPRARRKPDRKRLRFGGASAGCAAGYTRVQPVGSRPAGASPYGCLDMAGNAWEWVQGFYSGNREQRVLRGGAVGYGERSCRTYARAIEGSGAT